MVNKNTEEAKGWREKFKNAIKKIRTLNFF